MVSLPVAMSVLRALVMTATGIGAKQDLKAPFLAAFPYWMTLWTLTEPVGYLLLFTIKWGP